MHCPREKLERRLCDFNSLFCKEAERLLRSWPTPTGTYLGRLAHKHPDRVQPSRTGETGEARNWIILRKPEPLPVTP